MVDAADAGISLEEMRQRYRDLVPVGNSRRPTTSPPRFPSWLARGPPASWGRCCSLPAESREPAPDRHQERAPPPATPQRSETGSESLGESPFMTDGTPTARRSGRSTAGSCRASPAPPRSPGCPRSTGSPTTTSRCSGFPSTAGPPTGRARGSGRWPSARRRGTCGRVPPGAGLRAVRPDPGGRRRGRRRHTRSTSTARSRRSRRTRATSSRGRPPVHRDRRGPHGGAAACSARSPAQHGPVALVHFDAHLDTWDTYFDAPVTHGTMFRRAFEEGLLIEDHSHPRRDPRPALRPRGPRRRRALRVPHRPRQRHRRPGHRRHDRGDHRTRRGPARLPVGRHRRARPVVRAGHRHPGGRRADQPGAARACCAA